MTELVEPDTCYVCMYMHAWHESVMRDEKNKTRWVPNVRQVEHELVLGNTLGAHGSSKPSLEVIDGNGAEAQTEDTVHLASQEGDTRLLGDLGKGEVGNDNVTNSDLVNGEEARNTSTAISNREVGTILLVSRALAVVVASVRQARDANALLAGDLYNTNCQLSHARSGKTREKPQHTQRLLLPVSKMTLKI